jgi:corrinoid protein of di/trimethylamine methyltransferase
MVTLDNYLNDIIQGVIDQDEEIVKKTVETALDAGIDPMVIINEGLTVSLDKVGELFAEETFFLPELILCGEIVTAAMEKLEETLKNQATEVSKKGKIIMATVQGDVHDIGKNLVVLIMGASGYEVVDLGKNVSPSTVVEKTNELKPDIVALSALLSTTMPGQKDTIQALEEAGIRDRVKVMVGGAPVTRAWAEQIKADGYAEDASSAVIEANRILGFK